MLILSRKECEGVTIGDNIIVTIERIEGGKVKLGIKAPREVPVVRTEKKQGGTNDTQQAP